MNQPMRFVSRVVLLSAAMLCLWTLGSTVPDQPASAFAPVAEAAAKGVPCHRPPPVRSADADTARPRLCTPTPTSTTTTKATPTSTATATPTNTALATNTPTPTNTALPTNTPTPTNTALPTNTPTPTSTPTPTPIAPASITVYNTGAFYVQYYVSYTIPNAPLQSLYSGVFTINQGVTLTIPGNATNVGVLIQNYTGITGWFTACTRSYAQATSVVIIVSGTTFIPSCTGG